MRRTSINFPLLFLVFFLIPGLFYAGLFFAKLETDIVSFLPDKSPIFSDATSILQNRLTQDRVIVDLAVPRENPDLLVEGSHKLQKKMRESGLFDEVGFQSIRNAIPGLVPRVVDNLPILFNERQLEEQITPLLNKKAIKNRLRESLQRMHTLDSLGQAHYLAGDPLGFKNLVLSRLSQLTPGQRVRLYKGEILSPEGKHLLVIARLNKSGTDTAYARKLESFLQDASRSLTKEYAKQGQNLTITPMGSYRAALDNERIIREDVTWAILLASCGIALLLLLVFHRPLIGLLAFLPALAGTATSFFLLSLLHDSIALLVLGFGGAIISITVDHGIAYLLFMDRSRETYGRYASREILALGLITALTTIGAFSALCLTNFPLFAQLGQFSALGIAISFLFVHSVFPHIFPVLSPAKRKSPRFRKMVEGLFSTGKPGLAIALGFAAVMLVFFNPTFNVDLGSMNTVSEDTRAAERTIKKVWGKQYLSSIHLMTTGESLQNLRKTWDRLQPKIRNDLDSDILETGFIPSMIFPGNSLSNKHFESWKDFWDKKRVSRLKKNIKITSEELGYNVSAFDAFFKKLTQDKFSEKTSIPQDFFSILNINKSEDNSMWRYSTTLKPGTKYDASTFYEKYKTQNTKIFDPTYFSNKLGDELRSSFLYLLVIIGISIFFFVLLFFLDIRLALLAFIPVVFAFICTLGSLSLLGHPIGIPGLMLSIVVFGMGIDYSLLIVRSFQRYGDMLHINFQLIRLAVTMAALSSLIGFGALLFAEHTILRSAGIVSFLGLGYSLIGAFVLLPFFLNRLFRQEHRVSTQGPWKKRVLARYRNIEAYPKLFARCKLAFDPMFSELHQFMNRSQSIKRVMDVGCGFAVPSCAALEWFPQSYIYCIEPSIERCRVGSRVIGSRGYVEQKEAPHIPKITESIDVTLMIDMIHYINNDTLYELLNNTYNNHHAQSLLIIRAVVPPSRKPS